MLSPRQLWRAAVAIQEQYHRPCPVVSLPAAEWSAANELQRLIAKARLSGWDAAADRLTGRLQLRLEAIQSSIVHNLGKLDRRQTDVSPAEIHSDLVALQTEFPDVQCDFKHRLLTVTVDSVWLEDVNFGTFQIALDWCDLEELPPYRIHALDPRPAASSDDVTHPHVKAEYLCEGDGKAAIRAALDSGRLLDFFTIVDRTLRTYNHNSAFVQLEYWDSGRCEGCGDLGPEPCGCPRCGTQRCEDCGSRCGDCGESYCGDCLNECADCTEEYCSHCLTDCNACRQPHCAGCLPDHDCPASQRKEHDDTHPSPVGSGVVHAA